MKFLFFTHDIDDGGAARSLLTLVKQLRALNHSVQIVTFLSPHKGKIFGQSYAEMGVKLYYFPWAWLTGKFKNLTIDIGAHRKNAQHAKPMLPQILSLAANVDCVCFNGYPSASLAGSIQHVQKVLIAREQLDSEDKQYSTIAKYLARNIDKGVGISPAESNQLSNMGIAHKQIFNAAQERPIFSPLPPSPLKFGVFGAIYQIKGQRTLVEACALQQQALRQAKATIQIFGVGVDVPLVLQAIKAYHIEDIVIYKGWTDNVESNMRSLHWIVRPDHDGSPWGRDVIEAMSLGRPVLATGSADCFIKPGKTGLLIPPKDSMALGIALKNICNNETQACTYAENAFAFARKEFDPQTQAIKFIDWVSA